MLAHLPALVERGVDHDESLTLITIAGLADMNFPEAAVSIAELKARFAATIDFSTIGDDLRRRDVHPPLYFWALKAWADLTSNTLFWLRFFSTLCWFISMFVIHQICKLQKVDRREELFVIAFSSAMSGCFFFSVEARPYLFVNLLLLLQFWFRVRVNFETKRKYIPFWNFGEATVLGLSLLTNFLGGFIGALMISIFSLIELARAQTSRRRFEILLSKAVSLVPLILSAILVWPYYLAQRHARPDQDHGYLGPLADLKAVFFNFLKLISASHSTLEFVASGAIFGLAVCGLVQMWRRQPERRRFLVELFIFLGATVAAVMLMALIIDKHLHRIRYYTMALPALGWLVSLGIFYFVAVLKQSQTFWRSRLARVLILSTLLWPALHSNWGVERSRYDFFGGPFRNLARDNSTRCESPCRHLWILRRGPTRDLAASLIIEAKAKDNLRVLVWSEPYLIEDLKTEIAQSDFIEYFGSHDEDGPNKLSLQKHLSESGFQTQMNLWSLVANRN